ncbi:MAG: hypothetical protein WCI37_01040 [bacterium]
MNNEKIVRKPRQSTHYWRQAFAQKAIESDSTLDIPDGSKLVFPRIVVAEMDITNAHILRNGRTGDPDGKRSSFAEIILRDGDGWVPQGIGLAVSPEGSKSPELTHIEKESEKLSLSEKQALIGKLASRISEQE